ncbi:MAG: hypothetical protein ACP5OZ_00925 [Candidatus Woesearchaeota archaeon]
MFNIKNKKGKTKRQIIGLFSLTMVFVLTLMMLLNSLSVFASNKSFSREINVYMFGAYNCPHCAAEKPYLEKLSKEYPINVYYFEVTQQENYDLWEKFCNAYNQKPKGVPNTFIGDKFISGFVKENDSIALKIKNVVEEYTTNCNAYEDALSNVEKSYNQKISINIAPIYSYDKKKFNFFECSKPNETKTSENLSSEKIVTIPVLGDFKISSISLPIFTIIIAGLDSFNPCALWVLTFLLSLLIYSKSRKKMLIVGLIFVIASGVVYFMFMAAWLNLFLVLRYQKFVRIIIVLLALFAGIVNVKDAFFYKKGISLTIDDSKKPKLIEKMRSIVKTVKEEGITLLLILQTIILAVSVNFIELACTAGFPAVYTNILTLKQLPKIVYYLYLVLYNIFYVIPLLLIVLIFVITLGATKISERTGRILKFISGIVMIALALIMLLKPSLLSFGA